MHMHSHMRIPHELGHVQRIKHLSQYLHRRVVRMSTLKHRARTWNLDMDMGVPHVRALPVRLRARDEIVGNGRRSSTGHLSGEIQSRETKLQLLPRSRCLDELRAALQGCADLQAGSVIVSQALLPLSLAHQWFKGVHSEG